MSKLATSEPQLYSTPSRLRQTEDAPVDVRASFETDAASRGSVLSAQSGRELEIVALNDALAPAWDAFVAQSTLGVPQHLAAWQQVLQRAYGYRTHYLMAVETATETDDTSRAGDDRGANGAGPIVPTVRGVLPLFFVDSPLLGLRLMTPPGGLCAEDEQAAEQLLAHAKELARQAGARSLALPDGRAQFAGFHTDAQHETRVLDLSAGEEAVLKGLDRNIRRQIRLGERNGITVEIDRTGQRIEDFYSVMSRFTHQAGTPIFGRQFLHEVVRALPGKIHLAMAYHGGEPVGGYFQLALGDTLHGVWGATLAHALPLRAVYLAYWQIMADGMANGFRYLDMGRSPVDSNPARYKAQWGGKAAPVYQQVWRPDGAIGTTVGAQAQTDGRFQFFRRVWPRVPYALSLWLGPVIRRQIPFG